MAPEILLHSPCCPMASSQHSCLRRFGVGAGTFVHGLEFRRPFSAGLVQRAAHAFGIEICRINGRTRLLVELRSNLARPDRFISFPQVAIEEFCKLDEAGLLSAVKWYIDGFARRSKIEVDLEVEEDFGRLPQELETAIFRTVQECLTNIHRHSGSSTARIRLVRCDGEVLLLVRDNGIGMVTDQLNPAGTAATPGVGIRGMRERLRQLGGTLQVSSPGRGTVVEARVPIATPSTLVTEVPPQSQKESATAGTAEETLPPELTAKA
jgi:anti-sigma regulatory factor (Ser/Thr protein kinase)